MPIHRIEQLGSLETNAVDGVGEFPSKLLNLVNDRLGGYIPYGTSTTIADTSPGYLIGQDTIGYSSYDDNSANAYFALFNGVDTPTVSAVAIPSRNAVHLPGAGGFSRRDAFYVYGFDSSGVSSPWSPPASTEYTDITIESVSGNLPAGPYYIMTVTFFNTLAGSICVGYTSPARTIFAGDDNGLKITAPTMTDGLYMNVYIIDANQGPPLSLYPAIFTGTLQSGEDTTIEEMPLLRSIGSYGSFILISFRDNPVAHQGSLFGTLSSLPERYSRRGANLDLSQLDIKTTLVWTDVGWGNLASPRNFVKFTPTQSTEITGYVSTPGSLLVFMENETYRLVGTSNRDFTIQPFPVPLGCDFNAGPLGKNITKPALLGSTPFVIWNGKLYAVDYGNAQEVSKPVWLPSDPFVEVGVDTRTTDVLVRSTSNVIYRFNPEYQHWSENTISGDYRFLSHPDADGCRYYEEITDMLNGTTPAEPAADADEDLEPVPPLEEEEDEPASTPDYGGGGGGGGGGGSGTDPEPSPSVIARPEEVLYADYPNIFFDFDADILTDTGEGAALVGEGAEYFPDLKGGFTARQTDGTRRPVVADTELPVTYSTISITDAPYDPESPNDPVIITTASSHGWDTRDRVVISGDTGNTNINGTWRIQKLSDTTFYIYDDDTGERVVSNAASAGTPIVGKKRPKYLEFDPAVGRRRTTQIGGGFVNQIEGIAGLTVGVVMKTSGSLVTRGSIFSVANPARYSSYPIAIFYSNGSWALFASPRKDDRDLFISGTSAGQYVLEAAITTSPSSALWRVAVFVFDFANDAYDIYHDSGSVTSVAPGAFNNTLSLSGLSCFADIGGYNFGDRPAPTAAYTVPSGRDSGFVTRGGGSVPSYSPNHLDGSIARVIGYRSAFGATDAQNLVTELESRYL